MFNDQTSSTGSSSNVAAARLYYALRIAGAMCFIGHGAFGIITKQVWLNYFAVFGIGHDLGYQLMPLLGSLDILFGISLLVYPTRAVAVWLVIWGTTTALLRPLSGEAFAEALERAGNFGAPFALLLVSTASFGAKGWFKRLTPKREIDAKTAKQLAICLRVFVFLLLVGHGWLNLIEKHGLLAQYAALGFANPAHVAHLAGAFEVTAAFAILLRPFRTVLLALLVWKMASELFYPHWEAFEWIERGGSYGCLLALWFVTSPTSTLSRIRGWVGGAIRRPQRERQAVERQLAACSGS